MEEKEKKKKKKKQQKHSHQPTKAAKDPHFKLSSDVKGIRFGGQFIVKSFTIRRAAPIELQSLLASPARQMLDLQFASATAYIPTNFTILAHHAWHTLTLGLGTKNSKVLVFIFETESMKLDVDRVWLPVMPLGDVNKKLIKGLVGCEMARFKFRKGCLTFYLYAVRRLGAAGFARAADLRCILESVVALNDFLDHNAMLALPGQQSINFPPPFAVVH